MSALGERIASQPEGGWVLLGMLSQFGWFVTAVSDDRGGTIIRATRLGSRTIERPGPASESALAIWQEAILQDRQRVTGGR